MVRVRVRFLWIGMTRQTEYRSLEERYLERIGRLISCDRLTVAETRKTDKRQARSGLRREARLILKRIEAHSHLICMDHRGKMMSSRQLAKQLRSWEDSAIRELVFVVGGFMGIPAEVQARARASWSLSRMTLPHELARLVLLEQTYRALTMIRGLPYHR